MKTLLLITLLISTCGCSFIYDSRNQNSLNLKGVDYKGGKLDKGLFKTGRLIKITAFDKESSNDNN